MNENIQTATLGSGCFWCSEAIYLNTKGVLSVKSGYSGGQTDNPTYEQVCTGRTGHAEVIQITFDSSVISYEEILTIFFKTHDPTTLNQQGADHGTEYRSIILYHNEKQKEIAQRLKTELDDAKVFQSPIVTQIVPFVAFYIAEDIHQNFYNRNADQYYCQVVINPKLHKFYEQFKDKVKK